MSGQSHQRMDIVKRKFMGKKIFIDKRRLFTGKLNLELKEQIINEMPFGRDIHVVPNSTVLDRAPVSHRKGRFGSQ